MSMVGATSALHLGHHRVWCLGGPGDPVVHARKVPGPRFCVSIADLGAVDLSMFVLKSRSEAWHDHEFEDARRFTDARVGRLTRVLWLNPDVERKTMGGIWRAVTITTVGHERLHAWCTDRTSRD